MQPYIFPYLGYFQLVSAVDVFVFYDDVNFIKQGWINRNKVLINGEENLFTIPVKNISSFRQINETEINYSIYEKWKGKFLKSLTQSYKKAPYYEEVMSMVIFILDKKYYNIANLAAESIQVVSKYLDLKTEFVFSSKNFAETRGLDKAERLIKILNQINSNHYINPAGGSDLYEKEYFQKYDIKLEFIKGTLPEYSHPSKEFISGLSIIDVLMWNSKGKVNKMLKQYSLN